jgi:putative endonuclease
MGVITRVAEMLRNRLTDSGRAFSVWKLALAGRWSKFVRKREPSAHEAGRWGEKIAETYLRRKGYRILGRRVRFSQRDELDLVARQDDVLVFVEVKARRSEDYGRPIAAINATKRRTMTRAALRYIGKLKQKPPHIRFDVVEVVGAPHAGQPVVRHIESCFTLRTAHRIPW